MDYVLHAMEDSGYRIRNSAGVLTGPIEEYLDNVRYGGDRIVTRDAARDRFPWTLIWQYKHDQEDPELAAWRVTRKAASTTARSQAGFAKKDVFIEKLCAVYRNTQAKIGKYIHDLFEAEIAQGEYFLSVTKEVLDSAPRLPSGKPYPITAGALMAINPNLDEDDYFELNLIDHLTDLGYEYGWRVIDGGVKAGSENPDGDSVLPLRLEIKKRN